MSSRKLPPDAFEFYYGLGPGRSYQSVANHYAASKTAVANLADREDWQSLVANRDAETREESAEAAKADAEERRERQLKIIRLMQQKAIEALTKLPLATGMDGIKALAISLREERLTVGEPTDRTEVNVQETIRSEYERWLAKPPKPEDRGE